MATLPASLLASLNRSETEALTTLATSPDPSEATPSMRSFADARLLSLTPTALTTLEELLSASDLKVRQAAATQILDRSPATRPAVATSLSGGLTLPTEAVTALLQGLGTLLSAVPPAKPIVADATIIDKE